MQHYTDAGQLKQGIEYLILVIGMLANTDIHLVIGRISTVVPYLRITGRLLTLPEYILQKIKDLLTEGLRRPSSVMHTARTTVVVVIDRGVVYS